MNELIPAPVHRVINGRDWYIQEVKNSNGELILVNLYDEDGYFVSEHASIEDAVKSVSN